MKELELAKARVQELESSVASLTAEKDKLEAALEAKNTEVVEMAAKANDTEALQAEVRRMRGEANLAKYAHKLLPKHLQDADGKDTPLKFAAFEDTSRFEFMASLIPEPTDPVEPKGGEGDNGVDAEQMAFKMARAYCDEHKSVQFTAAVVAARQAISDGKTVLTL